MVLAIGLTESGVVTSTRGAARLVLGLPFLCRNLVSTPAVLAVGQAHDVLVELQTDQLAVTRRLKFVRAVVLERQSGLEAADGGHGACGLCDGGRCDGVLDGWGARVGRGHGDEGGRYKGGCEAKGDHGGELVGGLGGDVAMGFSAWRSTTRGLTATMSAYECRTGGLCADACTHARPLWAMPGWGRWMRRSTG